MKTKTLTILLATALCLIFLNSIRKSYGTDELKKLHEEVSYIRNNLSQLESKLIKNKKKQEYRHRYLNQSVIDLMEKGNSNKLLFNIKNSNGFQVVHAKSNFLNSPSGYFFINVKDVQPHLDGFKIIFQIANPQYCTFYGLKIALEWNVRIEGNYEEEKEKWDAWEARFKKREYTILKDFTPGSWTDAEVFLCPCTNEELECVRFSVQTSEIKLFHLNK